MAVKRRMCVNHPDRPAIGVCVITKKPVCSECSTRYEGVNYSKEGLEVLKRRRAAGGKATGLAGALLKLAMLVLIPLAVYMVYAFFLVTCRSLIDLQQAF